MNVKTVALNRALAMLNAAGARYVVITAEGETHAVGGLEVAEKREPKRHKNPARPVGTLVKYYKPLIENMAVGDVVVVPYNSFACRELRSAMSAWTVKYWGKGSSIIHANDVGLELLRLA